MTGRLRKAGMGADAYHRIDPVRARDGLDDGANGSFGVEAIVGGEGHDELVAADAAATRMLRQDLAQTVRHRDDQFVAAEDAEIGINIGHAVELDDGESRDLVVGAFGQHQVEQFERLGVVGQPRQFIDVAGLRGQFLGRAQRLARAAQLPQRVPGKADQQSDDADDQRHQAVHGASRRMRFIPSEETGNSSQVVEHGLHLTPATFRLIVEF